MNRKLFMLGIFAYFRSLLSLSSTSENDRCLTFNRGGGTNTVSGAIETSPALPATSGNSNAVPFIID